MAKTIRITPASGSIQFEDDNSIASITTSGSVLTVSGSTNFKNGIIVTGSMVSTAPASFSGSLSVTGSLGVTGTSTAAGLTTAYQFNTLYNGDSYKVTNTPVLDYGDGLRILYAGGSHKITMYTNSGTPRLQIVNNGNIQIGTTTDTGAKFTIQGSGTTSSTTALLVQNANASASFQVKDNSEVVFATPDYTPNDAGNPFAYLSKTRTGIYIANTANNFGISYEGGQIYANIGYSTGNPTLTPSNGVWTTNSRINATSLRGTNGIFVSGLDKFVAAEGGTDLNIVLGGSTSVSGQGRIIAYGETHSPKRGKLELYSGTDPVYGVISFSPGNTETARFTPDGNFNIGTITGSAKLLISGSSNSVLFEIDSPAVNNILYVSGSGNVGIGTNTPSQRLEVDGNISLIGSRTIQPVTSSVNTKGPTLNLLGGLAGTSSGNGGDIIIKGGNGVNTSNTGGDIYIQGGDKTGSQRSGYIYIGAASGQYQVYLQGAPIFNWDGPNASNAATFQRGGATRFSIYDDVNLNANYFFNSGANTINAVWNNWKTFLIKGSGTTSSTTALLVQNANASSMLSLTDNGALTLTAFQTSSTSITVSRTNSSMGGGFNLATMGSLVNLTDTVGNSNASKTTLYINTAGASQNNALIVEAGYVGFGTTSPGSGFNSAYFTTLAGLRVNYASDYQITSRDYTSRFNTLSGGGISFWGDASGQASGQTAYAGIRGLKANNTYVNPLGNLAFYVQTGSSSHVITETTFKEVGRFNELGYFGIGTSTPSASLHISGSGTTSATTSLWVQNGSGATLFKLSNDLNAYLGENSKLWFKTTNQNAWIYYNNRFQFYGDNGYGFGGSGVRILSSGTDPYNIPVGTLIVDGNVGIGTTSPGAKTHIFGSGTTSSTKTLVVQNNASNNSLIVLDNGSVGIGTNQPVGQLNVFGGTANAAAILTLQSQAGGGGNTGIYFRPYQNETFANSATAQATILAEDSSYSAHIKFSTKVPGASGNALTERMRIVAGGNILMGTTTDTGQNLQVNGAIKSGVLTTDGPVVSTSGVLGSIAGYTGMVNINTFPPVTLDIQNGIIVNVL